MRAHAAGLTRSRAAWGLGIFWALIVPSWAADGASNAGAAGSVPAASALLEFNIPALPLETALFRYGETSRTPALFPSELTAGLHSTPLRGRHSPEDALQRLLQGTGLVAEKMATAHGDVFRIRRAAAPELPRGGGDHVPADRELDGYPARVQASMLRALCSEPLAAPGAYRALVEVRIGAAGKVDHASLVESTGERRRDAALLAALQRMHVGAPAPAAVAPVFYTVTLLPAAAGDRSPCRALADGVS